MRAVVTTVVVLSGCNSAGSSKGGGHTPEYVGREACRACHADQDRLFDRSDHDLAMQPADSTTVLGDFDRATFKYADITSTFSKKNGKFFVQTDGPDGKLQDFPIAYTFGVKPLQQYLIELDPGRFQALSIAWDARPQQEGGQRWFHLYPEERITHQDELHWTRRQQNWNYMCADCHSTNLKKNYDPATHSFHTTWSEIDVSCEACHGPGSLHVAWAHHERGWKRFQNKGLTVRLHRGEGAWTMKDMSRGIATWVGSPRDRAEVEMCARCHARRGVIADGYVPGRPFLDFYRPVLLEDPLYHPDGQFLEEDYEYGSFLQSRMYRAGVTCSDCHDPHRLTVRASGNDLCGMCHLPSKFDTPSHHHHAQGSEAARCVSCHMATRNYMVVDARRDHSFRVPRPDISATLGTPNACNGCHKDKTPSWSQERIVSWYGAKPRPEFATAIDAGRRGRIEAGSLLGTLLADPNQPPIVRATLVSLLPEYLSAASLPTLKKALDDEDPLVRTAALETAETLPPEWRPGLAAARLLDLVRLVRITAARVLADAPRDSLSASKKTALETALAELVASEEVNADRPEAHLNLSNLYSRWGRISEAEAELKESMALDSVFVPALVNLADLYRSQGRDIEGEALLHQALRIEPKNAGAAHALGLLYERDGRHEEALKLLRRAVDLDPGSPRYRYVYAIALQSSGNEIQALDELEKAHQERPADRDVLLALVSLYRERGDLAAALRLAALLPLDVQAQLFLR